MCNRVYLPSLFWWSENSTLSLLKCPFENKVSLILVDQNQHKHLVQTFKPTPASSDPSLTWMWHLGDPSLTWMWHWGAHMYSSASCPSLMMKITPKMMCSSSSALLTLPTSSILKKLSKLKICTSQCNAIIDYVNHLAINFSVIEFSVGNLLHS